MLVLSPEDVTEHSELLSEVETLSGDDASTLLECWVSAVKNEDLSWLDVKKVWASGGFYFFEKEEGSAKDGSFNVFEFINDKSEGLIRVDPLYGMDRVDGESRGVPEHPLGYDPMDLSNAAEEVDSWDAIPDGFPAGTSEDMGVPGGMSGAGVGVGGEHLTIGAERPGVSSDDEDFESTGIFDDDGLSTGNLGLKFYTIRVDRTNDTFDVMQGKRVIVGRSKSESDIQILGNYNISRRHASFAITDDGALYVKDEHSSNGTFVDGVTIGTKPRNIKKGQVVGLHRESLSIINEGYN